MTNEVGSADRRRNLLFELRYGRIACEREMRLFTRMDTAMRFLELAGASAVIIGVLARVPLLALAFGVLLALIPVISVVYDPRGKAFTAERLRARFAALAEDADARSDEDVQRSVRRLQTEAGPDPVKAIRFVAYNDALAEADLDPAAAYTLTRWQRFVAALA